MTLFFFFLSFFLTTHPAAFFIRNVKFVPVLQTCIATGVFFLALGGALFVMQALHSRWELPREELVVQHICGVFFLFFSSSFSSTAYGVDGLHEGCARGRLGETLIDGELVGL